MADEPVLPRLVWDEPSDSRPKRVHTIPSSPPPFSSDPVFSSDEDPSVDNYTAERKKRKYVGPWYRQRLEDDTFPRPKKTKRTLQRKLDSGVFMGSDCTDHSLDEYPSFLQEGLNNRLTGRVPRTRLAALQQTQSPPQSSPAQLAERSAQQEIERCLDDGNERIDLSSRNLAYLSNDTVKPLSTFACVPLSSQEHQFRPLTPSLKVFLSSNNLRELPGELFKLERLSVLSLRNNCLHELPSVIDNLADLVELNVANNRLRYLPYELLHLLTYAGKLQNLTIHPNPFLEPDADTLGESATPTTAAIRGADTISGTGQVQAQLQQGPSPPSPPQQPLARQGASLQASHGQATWRLEYKYRSYVRYLDIDGSLLTGPFLDDRESDRGSGDSQRRRQSPGDGPRLRKIPVAPTGDVPAPPTAGGRTVSRAPSLVESVLRTGTQWHGFFADLQYGLDLLEPGPPRATEAVVAAAEAITAAGGRRCSVCHHSFVIARTEWIEWWEIGKVQPAVSPTRHGNLRDQAESLVPFMRRGCSWACGPSLAPGAAHRS